MNANVQYKRLFLRNFRGLRDHLRDLRITGDAEFRTRIDEARRALLPPKSRRKTLPELPENQREAIYIERLAKYVQPYEELHAVLKQIEEIVDIRLNALAEHVTPVLEACWYRVKACSTSTYSTQGMGAASYAKATLLPLEAKLKLLGAETHIHYRERKFDKSGCPPYAGYRSDSIGDYELWANCPPWMADAFNRTITLSEASRAWGRTVNPLVFNPFLPHEWVNKHYAGTA